VESTASAAAKRSRLGPGLLAGGFLPGRDQLS